MSKYIIRTKGSDYPYFTEEIKKEDGKLYFNTISKNGTQRKITLLESEVTAMEEETENPSN